MLSFSLLKRWSEGAKTNSLITSFFLFLTGILCIYISRYPYVLLGAPPPPLLWGEDMATSFGVLLVAAAPIFYACCFLRRKGVDWLSIALFVTAAIVSLHYIHISNNGAYTNDVNGHRARINFIVNNWLNPYGYNGGQKHHPPVYYYIGAVFVWASNLIGNIDGKTAVRYLSWLCYLIFNVFNLLTLRQVKLQKISYFASVALLLLWPAGFHMASKISPEIMYYALHAVIFCYAMAWYHGGKQRDLMIALIVAGVALTVKTNAIIVCAFIGCLMLVALYRKRLFLTDFLTRKWVMVGTILCCCVCINMGKVILHGLPVNAHLGYVGKNIFSLLHYVTLNYQDVLTRPFNDWKNNQSFFDVMLKKSAFGEYQWTSPHVASAVLFLLIAIVFYSLLPWYFAKRKEWQGLLPYSLDIVISFLMLIWFHVWKGSSAAQDFRYIYPSLICFVIFFGKSQQFYQQRGMLVLTWLGPIAVALFSTLSVYFFWTNWR